MWLELYIVGCITAFGITLTDEDGLNLKVVLLAIMLSWLTVGLKLGELKNN